MPDWLQAGRVLDVCAVYFTTQLVRCAAFSFVLTGLVMLFRWKLFSNRTFAKVTLWALFAVVPFLGKLKLFYENAAAARLTGWMTEATMTNLWIDRIYMAGVLITALCIFGRRLRLRKMVAGMKKILIEQTNVRITDMNVTPFTIGLIRPKIVLPKVMADNYSEEELTAVLQHERTHIHLGHLWCYFVWDVLRCLLWVNPFLSVCQKYFRADMEDVCDKVCIQNSGKTAQEYGTVLLKSLKLLCAEQAGVSSTATYAGEKDFAEMKRRMEKIAGFASYQKGLCRGMTVIAAAAVCTILFAIHHHSYARCSEMDNMLVYQYDGGGTLISADTKQLRQMISYDKDYVYVDREAFEHFLRENNANGEIYIVFGGFQKLPGMGGGACSCLYEAGPGGGTARITYDQPKEDWVVTLFKLL